MNKIYLFFVLASLYLIVVESRKQDVLLEIGEDRYQEFLRDKSLKYMLIMFKGQFCASCNWLIYEAFILSYYYDTKSDFKVGYTLTSNFTQLAKLCDVDEESAIPEYRLISKEDKKCYSKYPSQNFEQWVKSYTGYTYQRYYVDELNDTMYHDYIDAAKQQNKNVFVLFYVPWSTECHEMTINYERIGKLFRTESHLLLTKINCQDNPKICLEYNTKQFPSYKYYSYLSENKNGNTTAQIPNTQYGYGILAFLNKEFNTFYTMDGTMNEFYGRIPLLDNYAHQFITEPQNRSEIRKLFLKEKNNYKETSFYFKYVKMLESKEDLIPLRKEYENKLNTLSPSEPKYNKIVMKYNILYQFIPLPTLGIIKVSPLSLERYKKMNHFLLLFFTTNWCQKCIDVKEEFKSVANKQYRDVIYLQMDGDLYSEYIDLNHVDGYPRFHWFNKETQKFSVAFVGKTKETIIKYIDEHINNPNKVGKTNVDFSEYDDMYNYNEL